MRGSTRLLCSLDCDQWLLAVGSQHLRQVFRMTRFLLLGLALVLMQQTALASPPKPPKDLVQQVIKLEQLLSDATASADLPSRAYTFIEVPKGDGKQLAVVTFSIGGFRGGVGSTDYLALFLRTQAEEWREPQPPLSPNTLASVPPHWKLLAYTGVRGYHRIDPGTVEVLEVPDYLSYESALVLRLGTLQYQGTDGRCCPSGRGSVTYRLENEHLLELVQ